MDSRATEHAVNNLMYFEKVTKIEGVNFTVADGSKALATHKGEALVMVTDQPIILKNVYYGPSLHLNVMSCARLDERGLATSLAKGQCLFYHRKERNEFLGSIPLNDDERLHLIPIKIPKDDRRKLGVMSGGTPSNQNDGKQRSNEDISEASSEWQEDGTCKHEVHQVYDI